MCDIIKGMKEQTKEDKEWKALFVKEPTHHKVVVKAKEARMTVDEFVLELLNWYEPK